MQNQHWTVFIINLPPTKTTTYLTIDTLGAYGNNGHKTAKEYLLWSGNRYKKPFVAERA